MSQSNKSLDVNETLVSTEAFLIKNKQKLVMALVDATISTVKTKKVKLQLLLVKLTCNKVIGRKQ